MMNNVILTGRLIDKPKENTITIAIPRNYKNSENFYDTDFIPCLLSNTLLEKVNEYLQIGDLIGIRGRLEQQYNDYLDKVLIVNVDKLTFLSSHKPTGEENN